MQDDEAPTEHVNAPAPETRFGLRLNGVLLAWGPLAALRKLNTNGLDGDGVLVRLARRRKR